ncbi:thiopeptide-type bacteriocin biosynthesis protein [Streptomyces sp. SCL15-4]|uniref:thiopeptide-type bacteriocin biosynthesis protein n=1 Tax=Streptomyces sp. SCL15-4 TaxID=2967221 RepID=UPI002966407A|nr:thiopeptide-type bacteriocin biosynthesis protein [Streptomyces sp. SCL15-4]
MVRVERLLADCLDDARAQPLGSVPLAAQDPGYPAARRTFLAAGLDALRAHAPEAGWVQLGLDTTPSPPYDRLAAAARELLGTGQARDFFFMHKPPGLRVRFRAAEPARTPELRAALLRHLEPRRTEDTRARPVAGVYEPETYLFGGPRSMPWVHALFTADSRAWLDVHTAVAGAPAPVGWRVSLALLHAVFDGLDIVGWEHRGVWQVVREETGRRLPGGLGDPDLRRAAAGIRAYWDQSPEDRLQALPKAWRDVVGEHLAAVGRAAERWRTHYFASGDATVGPRRAAAHHVIFHWNRGALPTARQCLLTEALAADGREGAN